MLGFLCIYNYFFIRPLISWACIGKRVIATFAAPIGVGRAKRRLMVLLFQAWIIGLLYHDTMILGYGFES